VHTRAPLFTSDLIGVLNRSNETSDSLFNSLKQMCQGKPELTSNLWVSIFTPIWNSMIDTDNIKALILLLSANYQNNQPPSKPNVIQVLMNGILGCKPFDMPPYLISHLGKSFNCWHVSIMILERLSEGDCSSNDTETTLSNTQRSLNGLYSNLMETDYWIGLWRRRSMFNETNIALSFQQIGCWEQAQSMYEVAQNKARNGTMPFCQPEYELWESQWIHVTKKLQQWELLLDVSKNDSDADLLLDSAWRVSDWSMDKESIETALKSVSDPSHSDCKFYEAFLTLLQFTPEKMERPADFTRLCDNATNSALDSWRMLPPCVSVSHIPLLSSFQKLVELSDAAVIQLNLLNTTTSNIDVKSTELKTILMTWRERLPNLHDDISIWDDLVTWRQHIFGFINKAYIPMIPILQQAQNQGPTNSYGYRGFHETAWIINRFAHVARKHHLTEACINALSKIYTLPNIEIQEAFFKLREQAKCHLLTPSEYPTGLDVINNTNLMYFTLSQKAEFFALKGVFLSKLNLNTESVEAFSSATQTDMHLGSAWGAWARYNDALFKDNSDTLIYAANACNCYLQASSLDKNSDSRKYLARILCLLGQDDSTEVIGKAYEAFKPDQQNQPLWYWIAFIPQLLQSLNYNEAKYTKHILMSIAKVYPQVIIPT